jgi:hypothetical protein
VGVTSGDRDGFRCAPNRELAVYWLILASACSDKRRGEAFFPPNVRDYGERIYLRAGGFVAIRLRPRISAAPGRNDPFLRWHGLREYETHRIPVGAMILDAKYCEWCGCNFLRQAQSETRYCFRCLLTIPALNVQGSQKLASQLIH